jgi:hypothetical protein
MTTSAPQWPGQEGTHEQREENTDPAARPELAPQRPAPTSGNRAPAVDHEAHRAPRGTADTETRPSARPPLRAVPDTTAQRLQPEPVPNRTENPVGGPSPAPAPGPPGAPSRTRKFAPAGGLGAPGKLGPLQQPAPVQQPAPIGKPGPDVGGMADLLERRRRLQRLRRAAARRDRFVVVRDAAERDLWVARWRARVNLPSPVAVTRDIALGLLEVEAGCRSAAQLERIFSPRLWEELEHRIGRRGGPLPSGRSLISVRCQEDRPGLADSVAVVWRGELVRPVALRLDARGGRWTVTELRWWRNETDTAMSPGRDGGTS